MPFEQFHAGAHRALCRFVWNTTISIGAVVDHSPHDGVDALGDRLGQILERLGSAALGPAQPGVQVRAGQRRIVAGRSPSKDLAQRHFQRLHPRNLQARMMQPVHRMRLLDRPAVGVLAHPQHQALDGLD